VTWIETFSGKRFDLLAPQTDQVDLVDIAHALARINRFTGHTTFPYSVAEHALHVEWLVGGGPLLRCLALHHDDSEAYVGDVSAPMKWTMRKMAEEDKMLPSYFDIIEDRVQDTILAALSLPPPTPDQKKLIKLADLTLLAAERQVFMPNTGAYEWNLQHVPSAELLQRLRDRYWRDARTEQIAERFLITAKSLLAQHRAS